MIERKENDYFLDIKKIIRDKKEGRIDYKEFGDLLLGDENVYSSENMRKAFYVLEKIFNKISKNTITEDSVLKEIEMARQELEKERIRLQDQKREYKIYLRQDARFEHLLNEMKKTIMEAKSKNFLSEFSGNTAFRNNSASLILSDWHMGMTINDSLNVYNNEIMVGRVKNLRDKIIKYCKLHNIFQLNIELLGDLIQGYIHTTSRISNEEDVIQQTIRCGEILGELIDDLAIHIPEINVYSCVGNHGRVSPNLKESLQTENFEKIIIWYLQSCVKCKNVNIKNCDIDIISYKNLNNVEIIATHGNLDRPNQIVNNYIKMYKKVPSEFHLGHTHFYQENDEYDINVVVNGTLSGMDDFAKSIRKVSMPCQVLRIYGNDICTYKIKLI